MGRFILVEIHVKTAKANFWPQEPGRGRDFCAEIEHGLSKRVNRAFDAISGGECSGSHTPKVNVFARKTRFCRGCELDFLANKQQNSWHKYYLDNI